MRRRRSEWAAAMVGQQGERRRGKVWSETWRRWIGGPLVFGRKKVGVARRPSAMVDAGGVGGAGAFALRVPHTTLVEPIEVRKEL
jgi:hypothetical protein